MPLTLFVRDAYWDGKKLKKGPRGLRGFLTSPSQTMAEALAAAAAALGVSTPDAREFVSLPRDGRPPAPVTSLAELRALAEDGSGSHVLIVLDASVARGGGARTPGGSTPGGSTPGGSIGSGLALAAESASLLPPPSPLSPRNTLYAAPGTPNGSCRNHFYAGASAFASDDSLAGMHSSLSQSVTHSLTGKGDAAPETPRSPRHHKGNASAKWITAKLAVGGGFPGSLDPSPGSPRGGGAANAAAAARLRRLEWALVALACLVIGLGAWLAAVTAMAARVQTAAPAPVTAPALAPASGTASAAGTVVAAPPPVAMAAAATSPASIYTASPPPPGKVSASASGAETLSAALAGLIPSALPNPGLPGYEPDGPFDPNPGTFRNDDMFIGRGLSAGAVDGHVRRYNITCTEMLWDYGSGVADPLGPGGHNELLDGGQIEAPYLPRSSNQKGWKKRLYEGWADDKFTIPMKRDVWVGIIGPTMRGEVGDVFQVLFWNNCTIPTSMHPHGLHYIDTTTGDSSSEGAWNQWATPGTGAEVMPGQTVTYTWYAAVKSGPAGTDSDLSSQGWWYHSHVSEATEINNGLLGAILITARGWYNETKYAATKGGPKDVDAEFVIALQQQQELNGAEAGNMYSVNGKIYGNLPVFTMTNGMRVRWYMLAIGNLADVHTVHFHGQTLIHRGYHTDVIDLLPGSMAVGDFVADNIGFWLIHCHVNEHLAGGMYSAYYVAPRPTEPDLGPYGQFPDVVVAGLGIGPSGQTRPGLPPNVFRNI